MSCTEFCACWEHGCGSKWTLEEIDDESGSHSSLDLDSDDENWFCYDLWTHLIDFLLFLNRSFVLFFIIIMFYSEYFDTVICLKCYVSFFHPKSQKLSQNLGVLTCNFPSYFFFWSIWDIDSLVKVVQYRKSFLTIYNMTDFGKKNFISFWTGP